MTHPLSSWDVFTSLSVSELVFEYTARPTNKVCLSGLSPPLFRPINGYPMLQVTCFKLSYLHLGSAKCVGGWIYQFDFAIIRRMRLCRH